MTSSELQQAKAAKKKLRDLIMHEKDFKGIGLSGDPHSSNQYRIEVRLAAGSQLKLPESIDGFNINVGYMIGDIVAE